MGGKRRDLTGERFGQLTVLGPAEDVEGREHWLCRCDCGKEKIVWGSSLKKGTTRSCGCLRRKNNQAQGKARGRENYQKAFKRYQARPVTLCISCIRSAAPPELQCIWDKSAARVLPEGAKTITSQRRSSGGTDYTIVTDCPEYLSIRDLNHQKILKEARKRNLALMALENNTGSYALPQELVEAL